MQKDPHASMATPSSKIIFIRILPSFPYLLLLFPWSFSVTLQMFTLFFQLKSRSVLIFDIITRVVLLQQCFCCTYYAMFFSSPKQWHSFKYYTTRKEAMAWRLGRLHFSSMKIALKLRKGEERSNLILGGNLVPCCFAADKSKENERKKRNKKKP